MKNQYNNLVKILEKGSCVVVKDLSDNTYCSILNHKDIDGDYRTSDWWDSIEESKQWIGLCNGKTREYWDDTDLEIVEIFRPEFEPFKIGDKVRLLDSIKNTEDWKKYEDWERYDLFVNMTGEVKQVYCQMMGTHYKVNGVYVGHEYLIPLIKEDEVEKAIKLLEERGRLKDGKILS